ncbi:FERM and PDZ domain-containing protein 2 isoform X1 [Pygocentrus nattereri]|uniref:FERM and PDZ domain-containing protein 2 isoform X1 n=2 Tax=Pygocentrus nattereri TaxID=42514 RepID=UPI001891B45A|nr:FERM and PDZ domain-containing protein 2 isoform X1 [Pygocentrus nattereri]XP_017569822.2 FERM and PDZ domain-containing protein 2 isoform X1 [Pygocentrus nattereri]
MSTFVTLAEVLESQGAPLEEGEVWALLLGAAEALVGISSKGPANLCSIISPGSMLLSPSGTVAFKACRLSEDVASFTSPETTQARPSSSRQDVEKMVVFSLGMTLYWTVDYHLPQNQPVQLSNHLNSLLLSMCEDVAHRRPELLALLEASDQHHKNNLLPPPNRVIRQLVQDVLQDPAESALGNTALLTDRSQLIRDRLRGSSGQNSTSSPKGNGSPSHTFQTDPNKSSDPRGSSNTWLSRSPYLDRCQQLNSKPHQSFGSLLSLSERRLKDLGPEFVRMLDEPLIILNLPSSIVSKKGKSCSTQRDLRVIMPNGQIILVKCDVKSRGGDVFDMIIAHCKMVEHFYFGLAYREDNEFFFLDNETKISKVAPESWKKVPTSTFVLYFRIKFFVSDTALLLHKLTRHQYYLQLRRDILEEHLPCNEETGLLLAALALQAEFGDSMPEVYGKNYYRPEHYVSKSILEKMALPCLKEELLRLHTNYVNMVAEESELEFLKAIQQLPEYGVLFYHVAREKKTLTGELLLGVCAKGVIVYEVKNNSRSASLRFHWRETVNICAARRRFVIESSISKKKHTFLMEKSKVARYLCKLCMAQHKFHKEMSSRQLSHSLASEDSIVQYAAVCRAQNNISCSEGALNDSGLNTSHQESMSKLCDDIASRIENRIKQHRDLLERSSATSPVFQRSIVGSQKRNSDVPSLSSVLIRDAPSSPRAPEREIVCVTLKKDPKLGLGIVIVGEDSTNRLDLGIFIASVVPGGPADGDGRIRPGGRLISLNQTSLEGMTFSEAAEILQNSPNQVELIISQTKVKKTVSSLTERSYESQTTLRADSKAEDGLDELVSMMMTPKAGSRLHVPNVRILNAQNDYSRSASMISLRPAEFSVQLKKVSGSLGFSIAGGLNAGLRSRGVYVKSLAPGGAAARDGRIQTGDRLLEVDGTRLVGYSDQQAAECLAKTREVVTLVLERDGTTQGSPSPEPRDTLTVQTAAALVTQFRNNSCPAITMTTPFAVRPNDYSFVSEENTMEVTLQKRLNGLGFSFLIVELDTSLDCGTVVRVKTLFPGQAAEESGLIQEGDVILAINGESLKGLSYQRVLNLLKGSAPEVKLVICRPAAGTLPPISEKIGQLTCS